MKKELIVSEEIREWCVEEQLYSQEVWKSATFSTASFSLLRTSVVLQEFSLNFS